MEVKIKVKRMHRRINNSAHCRLGKFFFGNLKWIVPEDKVSHLRARKNNRGAHKRERGENSSRGAGRRERGTSVPDSTCLGTFSQGICFCLSPPLARGLLKDYHDRALVLYPQPPAQVGQKCESTWGASTGYKHCTGRPSHPGTEHELLKEWDLNS